MGDGHDERSRPDRRRFLSKSALAALGVTGVGGAVVTIDFIHPKALLEPPTEFRVGKPQDFPVNSVTADHERKVYIVRTEAGFSALSAICNHLGCVVRYAQDEEIFACPCHGSRFGKDGSLVQGPARRGLRHIAVRLEDGDLIVDTAVDVSKETVLRA